VAFENWKNGLDDGEGATPRAEQARTRACDALLCCQLSTGAPLLGQTPPLGTSRVRAACCAPSARSTGSVAMPPDPR